MRMNDVRQERKKKEGEKNENAPTMHDFHN